MPASAQPGFVQGLLQSLQPWMTGANPSSLDTSFSQYGGTQGLLNAMLQGQTPAMFGRAMQGAQDDALQNAAARQGLAQQGLGLQFTAARQPLMLAAMKARLGQISGVPGSSANPPTASSGAGGVTPAFDASSATQPSAQSQMPSPPAPAPAPLSTGGQNPMGLLNDSVTDSVLGLPWAQAEMSAAKTGLQYDPSTATRMALAKDPLTLDQTMMAEAQQKNDPQGYISAYTKMLTDANRLHISSMSGNVTGFGLPPWVLQSMANYNTQSGKFTANGRQQLIPGAADTEQALAGAEARGRAQGDVEKVTDSNGNEYYVPRSALLGGGGQGGGQSGAASGASTPFAASLGPASEELLKSKGEQAGKANEGYQDQAEAGQQMLAQIAELRSAAHDFTPGQFAESRMKMLQWMQSTDLITPKEANELGSAQAGQKIAIQLQAAATKQLGSREAAQIFQVMGKSLPNLTLSPDGLEKVSAYMEGIARYNIARAQTAQGRFAGNDANGVNAVRDDFIKNTNPTYFILASASPETRAEMIASMGSHAKQFVTNWNSAARAGWAPRPGEYDGNRPGS